MMRIARFGLINGALLALLGLAACGGGSGGSTPGNPTSTATNTPLTRTNTATATHTAPPPDDTPTPLPASATSTKTVTRTPTPTSSSNGTPTSTATDTPVPSTDTPTAPPATATHTPIPPSDTPTAPPATATPTATSTDTPPSDTPSPTPGSGTLSIAAAIARDAHGVALQLNQTVTTEGIVTVSAGILANNKLKIFMQDGAAGIQVYHQSSADVPAFAAGDDLRVTGVIRQQDPTSDAVPLTGTVMIDVSAGSWQVLSSGNALPTPVPVTLGGLVTGGTAYTGSLVHVGNVAKASGNWPILGAKSTSVPISDDGGITQLTLRLQKNTITTDMVNTLSAIGADAFELTGIAVQNDTDGDPDLLNAFEIWVRGSDDITMVP